MKYNNFPVGNLSDHERNWLDNIISNLSTRLSKLENNQPQPIRELGWYSVWVRVNGKNDYMPYNYYWDGNDWRYHQTDDNDIDLIKEIPQGYFVGSRIVFPTK